MLSDNLSAAVGLGPSSGLKWGQNPYANAQASGAVTYSFTGIGVHDPHYNIEGKSYDPSGVFDFNYKTVIRSAFNAWSKVANIEFVEIQPSTGNVSHHLSNISVVVGNMDGKGGLIARGTPISSTGQGGYHKGGDLFLDGTEGSFWTAKSLYNVVLHEIGHAIGLTDDENVKTVWGEKFYNKGFSKGSYSGSKNKLSESDIEAAQYRYGLQDGKSSFHYLPIHERTFEILNGVDGLKLIGNAYGEELTGSNHDEIIHGRGGGDQIYGGGGRDVLVGGEGFDGLHGGKGGDSLFGDSGNDFLNGGDGNDYLSGGSDNDRLNGDAGNDRAFGSSGEDTVSGNDGDDTLSGGSGNDSLLGNSGRDRLSGGSGDDILKGGNSKDFIVGNRDNDTVFGESGDDTLYGGGGADLLYGGLGADSLFGDGNYDSLYGEEGDDLLYGNRGNDLLVGGEGSNYLKGGSGVDTASYADATSSVDINLHTGFGSGFADDILVEIENVIGSVFDDLIEGNHKQNYLTGNSGDDTLIGGDGRDTLDGGSGSDTAVFYGDASEYTETVSGSKTFVTHTASGKKDTLINIETIEYTPASALSMSSNSGASLLNNKSEIEDMSQIDLGTLFRALGAAENRYFDESVTNLTERAGGKSGIVLSNPDEGKFVSSETTYDGFDFLTSFREISEFDA